MDTLTFKLPAELNAKLEHFAKLDDRPKSYLIRKAVEEFLLEMEEDEADRKAGMAALANPGGPSIPWEEVIKKYGLEN